MRRSRRASSKVSPQRSYRDLPTSAESTIHKMIQKTEETGQCRAGQALGDRGRRAVEDQEKAEAFARTYANVRQQINKLQDHR